MPEIFPSKFTPFERTTVAEAAALLARIKVAPVSVANLYVTQKEGRDTVTFDSFAAALTLLFAIGVIDYEAPILRAE